MARKPFAAVNQQREARERAYRAARAVGSFRGIGQVVVEMSFRDPEGKLSPSPQSRVFDADMQAFFDFLCPLRDCTGGGFDANATVLASLGRRGERSGKLVCQGTRPRKGAKDQCCNLELTYTVVVREKEAAAA